MEGQIYDEKWVAKQSHEHDTGSKLFVDLAAVSTLLLSMELICSHSAWCEACRAKTCSSSGFETESPSRCESVCMSVCVRERELCDGLAACPHCLPAFCGLLWVQLPVDCTMWSTKQTPCCALYSSTPQCCSRPAWVYWGKNPHFIEVPSYSRSVLVL